MNFDIKDVKSWATRKDVKIGDKGYVANSISQFRELNIDDAKCGKVSYIDDNWNLCFKSDLDDFTLYAFFLPLSALKANKPKKYRPFRTIAEVDELLVKDNVKHYCYVGSDLYLRYKVYPNITKHIEITNLEVDTNTNELRFINGFTPRHLAENYDIKIAGCWLPFGVEENED
jgi:hypothetical protein|nr:MAG TPA_asm: hypothetical protein [Caudoviricetes sp.]